MQPVTEEKRISLPPSARVPAHLFSGEYQDAPLPPTLRPDLRETKPHRSHDQSRGIFFLVPTVIQGTRLCYLDAIKLGKHFC